MPGAGEPDAVAAPPRAECPCVGVATPLGTPLPTPVPPPLSAAMGDPVADMAEPLRLLSSSPLRAKEPLRLLSSKESLESARLKWRS
eukprot:86068-Prorocentrum_minimum.AAC.1